MLMPFTVSRQRERRAGVLHPDEPADQRDVGECGRRSPDADEEVAHALAGDRLARFDQIEGEPADRPLRCQENDRERERDQERTGQRGASFVPVAGAEGLGGETRGAHA